MKNKAPKSDIEKLARQLEEVAITLRQLGTQEQNNDNVKYHQADITTWAENEYITARKREASEEKD